MGFFDKKYCDICGEKIGLFGNRKLLDGNMCSHCAKLLSPWFDDRRDTSIEGIKAQLAAREENKKAVAAFNVTCEIGGSTRVLLDEDAGKFMVTDARLKRLDEENPDVFDLKDVVNCRLRVGDSRRELTRRDSEGNRISYNPPRFEYSYHFYITITLNHPYVDEIHFQLNDDTPIRVQCEGDGFWDHMLYSPENDLTYHRYLRMAHGLMDLMHSEYGEEAELFREDEPY